MHSSCVQPSGCPLDVLNGAFEGKEHPAEVTIYVRLFDVDLDVELAAQSPDPGLSDVVAAGGHGDVDLGHCSVDITRARSLSHSPASGNLGSMSRPLYVVDAFTDQVFRGNPAAVVLLESSVEEEWMQSVAAEMKHAETAFLMGAVGGIELRWFTPTVEVDLCGHATLASAHVLYEQGIIDDDKEIRFYTRSGDLLAKKTRSGIQLDFPAEPGSELTSATEEQLMAALRLGVKPVAIQENRMDILVELPSEDLVQVLEPDFALLGDIEVRGVIVTAASKEHDFISRFFAPAAGVPEDPVTGSAHCFLAPYWGEKLGKKVMLGYQASSRGGSIKVALQEDRVLLTGKAVTVIEGELQC